MSELHSSLTHDRDKPTGNAPTNKPTGTIRTVRFFCARCGQEIWQDLSPQMKEKLTVKIAEENAICSDCLLPK